MTVLYAGYAVQMAEGTSAPEAPTVKLDLIGLFQNAAWPVKITIGLLLGCSLLVWIIAVLKMLQLARLRSTPKREHSDRRARRRGLPARDSSRSRAPIVRPGRASWPSSTRARRGRSRRAPSCRCGPCDPGRGPKRAGAHVAPRVHRGRRAVHRSLRNRLRHHGRLHPHRRHAGRSARQPAVGQAPAIPARPSSRPRSDWQRPFPQYSSTTGSTRAWVTSSPSSRPRPPSGSRSSPSPPHRSTPPFPSSPRFVPAADGRAPKGGMRRWRLSTGKPRRGQPSGTST